ncbi:UNVERIFIED_CONTAM: hypothetical protein Slati_3451000 [Sesamum latifolium]|uniref:Reverse transcriptase n=1 Tax=Sesamum latifolium TaxID=2727402 RepID=A0AAW2UJQ1_9LAMI
MTQAVLEFFQNGRLLKQVNATLLTLIPKVRAPTTVSDFRPISCCNVLYKAITKILVSRIKDCLDDLISQLRTRLCPGDGLEIMSCWLRSCLWDTISATFQNGVLSKLI